MKQLFRFFCLLSCSVMVLAIQSCKKPKEPVNNEPCKNGVIVMALETDSYYNGHFSYQDPAGTVLWLSANNWFSYSDKVVPGRMYLLAYREVPCSDLYPCGDNNQIAPGGCFPQRKCIEILCLREVMRSCPTTDCQNSEVTDLAPQAAQGNLSNASISGDKLSADLGFSGCNQDNYRYFKLVLFPDPNAGPVPTFAAKAIDTRQTTCMAVFQYRTCFDLSSIREYYRIHKLMLPQAINIKIVNGYGDTVTLTYKP